MNRGICRSVASLIFCCCPLAFGQTNFNDSFERPTYNWDTSFGCLQVDDPGDCQPINGGGTKMCHDNDVLGYDGNNNSARKFSVTDRYVSEGCSPYGTVQYWIGGSAPFHATTDGTWVAINTSAGEANMAQSHEMMVPKKSMSTNYPGWIQVDFLWEGVGAWPDNQHIDLASNVRFNGSSCSSPLSTACSNPPSSSGISIFTHLKTEAEPVQSTGCFATGTDLTDKPRPVNLECGYIQDPTFYAMSAGNFGGSCIIDGQNFGGAFQGFALGKAWQTSTTRDRCLVKQGRIPYTFQANTWYRMKLQRTSINSWTMTAWKFFGGTWNVIPGFPSTVSGQAGTDLKNKFASGDLLPNKVGFYGYWVKPGSNMLFDNFQGSW